MNRYESEVAAWEGKIYTDLDTLENMFEDQATLDKLAEFRTALETYLRIWREQVVPLSRANRDKEAFTLARKEGIAGTAGREAMYKLNELYDVNVAAANHRLKLANQDFRKSQYILSAVILLAIILGLAFGIRQGSLIAGSVNTVSKAAQLVAAGDLDQRVMVKTGDEIESMANSFDTMTVKLKTMVEELQREIIERRRAEDRLRESEQWLSTTLRSIGDAVIATDAEGLVTFMNPVAEGLTGWDESETAGKPLEDIFNIINDQTGGRAENPVARVLREGVVVGLANHTVLIAKDGTKRPIADSGAPIRDAKGEIIGTVMVFRDITESNRMEEELRKHRDHLEELVKDRTEALRESEEKYREVVETSVDGVISADSQMKVGVWNAGAERIFGYTKEDMTGQSLMKIVPERYKKEKENGFVEFRKSGFGSVIGKTIKLQGVRKDGTEIPVELSISSRKENETHIATAIVRDITERTRGEDALKNEKEKFRVLVEESPLGVSIIGEKGDYKYVNPKFVDMFGYTPEEIPTGREWFRKAYPDEEYRNQVIAAWINVITETRFGPCRALTFTARCKDGSKKVIRFLPVKMRTGGQILIYEDITEQKKIEAQLRQAQRMEAIGTLAGGVAHDFNNLLTAILGYAELSLMGLEKDNSVRQEIEEIKKAGKSAASLTRQLLAFSRKQIVQPKVVDLNKLLSGMEKMLGRLLSEDVELLTIPEPALWPVEIDPGQIEQVIMNLAINSGDAMRSGGKLTFETANVDLDENYFREHGIEAQPGAYVMLAVSDTGSGMDKETQEHIFEPFFTTKELGKGTGLGLSTVYGIVKQNNGFIWAYSEPGQGTTFKVYLPKVEGDAGQEEKERTPMEDLGGSETVLIVEDDSSLRKLARSVLKQKGYKILEAENGEEALKVSKAHDGSIDLMITDVVMPKMGGKETAERLQALYPQMKVIYMSGYTDNAIAHQGVLAPGLNFLEKPFSPKVLARKVREVLDK